MTSGTSVPPIDSIAVLPLENLSGDPEQEYFADGMTDELIAVLAQISALKVISRTSVMQYKEARKPLPEIARELNVDAVVEGTVRRAKDRVRVTAQLIEAKSDRHLWAESYERELSDVLTLQSDVARAIAQEIRIKLTGEEESLLKRSGSVDPKTHELYLKGLYHWNKRTTEDLWKGLSFFQRAVERDPGYALAYVGLSTSYIVLAGYEALPSREAFQKAKTAASKALELDETLAEAHICLATISLENDWDWVSAERGFRHAINLDPNSPPTNYAELLEHQGRFEEALAMYRRARELDPLSLAVITMEASVYHYARRYDRAIKQYQDVLDIDPDFIPAHHHLGNSFLQKQMFEAAIAELQQAVDLSSGNPLYIANLGHAYAVAGRRAEALEKLDEIRRLSKVRHVSALSFALIYTGLGENEKALDWLEKACEERYFRVLEINVDPSFERLRSEDRFNTLLQEMGLAK
jgi:TolB-like protein/Tfp pilus assembly protein PilF